MRPWVLVTGASGQDGLLVCRLLERQGFHVVGVVRQPTKLPFVQELIPEVLWIDWQTFSGSSKEIAGKTAPSVIIHLAANSSVPESHHNPGQFIGESLKLFDVVSGVAERSGSPMLLASSSQAYAREAKSVSENSLFAPASPYGIAKMTGQLLLNDLRRAGRLRGSSLILFNHESPLRKQEALSLKVSQHLADSYLGSQQSFELLNSDVIKDYSWAPDFAAAICDPRLWASNEDFVFASGEGVSMGNMVRVVAQEMGKSVLSRMTFHAGAGESGPIGLPAKAARTIGLNKRVKSESILLHMVQMEIECRLQSLSGVSKVRYLLDKSLEAL